MSAVSGHALRVACRKGLIDNPLLWRDPGHHAPCTESQLDAWIAYVESKLVQAEEGFEKAVLVREPPGWATVYAVAMFELEQADFGVAAEMGERRVPHSLVEFGSGLVYLPDPVANGPLRECGPRASVADRASFAKAVSDQTGMMRQFQGSARELLNLGVNADDGNAWGETSLMQAAGAHEQDVVFFLLKANADPNAQTLAGATALHHAVQSGQDQEVLETARVLLDSGADCNRPNHWGFTALHVAAFRGLLRTCALLTERGADKRLQDAHGHAAGHYASEQFCGRNIDGTLQYVASLANMLRVG
jgi:hypothetical protein